MKKINKILFQYLVILLSMISVCNAMYADDNDVLNSRIVFSKNKGTIYELLQEISQTTGYLFIYDSRVIDNDKKIKIPARNYTLSQAIYTIINNKNLKIKLLNKHILLYEQAHSLSLPPEHTETKEKYFSLKGQILDRITNTPIPGATISAIGSTIGTIANQEGRFQLMLPDSLKKSNIKFSCLGFENQTIEASILAHQDISFYLDPTIIPLQEIIVRVVDPLQALQDMKTNRRENYSSQPVYMTTFYREGISHKKNNLNITEAILQIYKSDVEKEASTDQVKMLKMRRIVNKQENDTLFAKLKSGINSSLLLDIIKGSMPDFINPSKDIPVYKYTHTDITTIDDRRVNVISFEPINPNEPLYSGELYIDAENKALVKANFEFYKKNIDRAAGLFIVKKNTYYDLNPQHIGYSVSYKQIDGVYYINHVRGDLNFKVKRKKRLFSSSLHIWFEMVNCQTEWIEVNRLQKKETISTKDVFADKDFEYDENFWGNFNVIAQEDELKASILKMIRNNK